MFFLMLRQSFVRGRRRKALAAITIALAASLISALMNVAIDVGDKMSRELKSYGANITIVPKSENITLEIDGVDYNPLQGQVLIDETVLPEIEQIFWHNNIVGYAPFLKVTAEIMGVENKRVALVGTHFDRHAPIGDEEFRAGVKGINPYWEVEGKWPQDDNHAGILAGAALARELHLKIGDQITLKIEGEGGKEEAFAISGILSTGGTEENALLGPLPIVQRLAGLEGKVQSVSVSALTVPEDLLSRRARKSIDDLNATEYDRWYCTAYVSSIAHQIEEAIPNVTARPVWQVAAGEGAVVNRIQLLLLVVTMAAFVASGLGISSLMVTTIMERSKEIGLTKALGAANWEVHLLFLSESALVGAIGGLTGCAAGAGLSRLIGLSVFGAPVSFNPIVIPVNVAVSIMIALAGSVMPSCLITRLDPAEVLHDRR